LYYDLLTSPDRADILAQFTERDKGESGKMDCKNAQAIASPIRYRSGRSKT